MTMKEFIGWVQVAKDKEKRWRLKNPVQTAEGRQVLHEISARGKSADLNVPGLERFRRTPHRSKVSAPPPREIRQ